MMLVAADSEIILLPHPCSHKSNVFQAQRDELADCFAGNFVVSHFSCWQKRYRPWIVVHKIWGSVTHVFI